MFENGAAAFQRKGKRNGPTLEVRKIEKLEAKLAQKNPNSSHRSDTGTFSTKCRLRMATFSSEV